MIQYELKMKKKSKLASKEDIAKMAGSKAIQMLFNLVSIGPRIILRSAFQLLRANIITRLLSVIFLIVIDVFSLVKGRISRKQFVLNIGMALMLLVGGTAGWNLGTAAINEILIENVILGLVGGILGAGILGAVLGTIWEKVIGLFVVDDAHEMMCVLNQEFNEMICEFNLDNTAAEQLVDEIEIDTKTLRSIFSSKTRQETCREILNPYFNQKVEI
ncbi:MAG: hypothetical protein FWC91_06680 [Defluviitaleaceae bacterium]|nr:hypothetical protein [Defluviitaleaceae bacterium]